MLSKLSVKKPYTVIVGIISVIVLGYISFQHMSTDLLPSYVLTIKQETLAKLFKQAREQFQTGIGQLDMEKIMEAAGSIFNYAMEMGEVMQNSVAFGEPVKGEYPLVDGVVFNTEKTLTVDVNAIMEAVKTFAAKVTADETIKSALESVASMIPGAEFDPAALALEDVPAEQLPEVTGLVYTITDDEGNETAADTYVIVNAKGKEDNSGDTNTYVYVNETSVDVIVEIPAEEVSVECYIEMGEDGVNVDFAISAPDTDIEIKASAAMGETGVALEGKLYVNDPDKPILTFSALFELVGERTKSAFDGEKAELALDGLADEQADSEVLSTLMMDLLTNGLGRIINNIKTAAPEQGAALEQMAGGLMPMFMGGIGNINMPKTEENTESSDYIYKTYRLWEGYPYALVPVPNGYELVENDKYPIYLENPDTGSAIVYYFIRIDTDEFDINDPEGLNQFYDSILSDFIDEYDLVVEFEVDGRLGREIILTYTNDSTFVAESTALLARDGIGIFVSEVYYDSENTQDTLVTAADRVRLVRFVAE